MSRPQKTAFWVLGLYGMSSAAVIFSAPFLASRWPIFSYDAAQAPNFGVTDARQRPLRGDGHQSEARWSDTLEARAADTALQILQRGNAARRLGSLDEALELWNEVIQEHPGTPAWCMAILNSGESLQEAGREAEAIEVLQKLLANPAWDDMRNRLKTRDVRIPASPLESYAGFLCYDWSEACQRLSHCHEAIGDFEKAREYAILARDRYPRSFLCHLESIAWKEEVNRRIEMLEIQRLEAADSRAERD